MTMLDLNRAHEYLNRRISPEESYQDLLSFPRFLEVETVNACNARCPMCTIADWERGFTPMTDQVYGKIAEEIIAHADEVKRVTLHRDGEPLIDKKLPARIAMLKDGGIKSTAISTNVSLLNEERSKALLEAGLDLIILSVDSLKKEVFENIRVRLVFEEVLENSLRFIELRDKMRPETQVWVRMISQEGNQGEWPEYQKFWADKLTDGTDRVYWHNINNWGGQLKGFKPISTSFEPKLPCVALWSLLVIFCNGDVPLCNVDFNNKYPTGNVLDHSIQELWQSMIMNERRNLHASGDKGQISLCANCNVWDESPDTESALISSEYATDIELRV